MSSGPAVSVIITTFNRRDLLCCAIESLLCQSTDVAYEVIVVDNCSTDDTRQVVERYAENSNKVRVTYLFESCRGISRGRNAGIRAARAALVAFIDDDCRASPEWVGTIKRTFDEHPEIHCIGGKVLPCWKHPPPAWLEERHWAPLAVTDHGNHPIPLNSARPVCLIAANLALRRQVFDRIGYFSPEFARSEDHELELRLFSTGGQALYVPTLLTTTDVPFNRCTKSYHRSWHSQHGRDCAAMRLNERIGPGGELLPPHVGSVSLFGIPPFLYREFLLVTSAWFRPSMHASASVTFECETRVIYLASYMWHRCLAWHAMPPGSKITELKVLMGWLLGRALRAGAKP